MDFTNRTAIITGAGSERGFGRSCAEYLADRGCAIIAVDIDGDGAQRTAEYIRTLGASALGVQVDVSDPASVNAMIERSIDEYGRIDILINNAGISQRIAIEDLTFEEWDRLMRINLYGTFYCSKLIVPHMRANHYGRIVTMSSVAGKRGGGVFGSSHYAASKAGQLGFSKALAREVATDGITVNCVCPGACKTDLGGSRYENKPVPAEILMGRRGECYEVAAAVAFLASSDASYITGEEIDVNGGLHID